MHLSRQSFGKGTGNEDVMVFTTYSIEDEFDVVLHFDLPPGALNVVDVVVLADRTTAMAKDYSLLCHMCMWYAFVIISGVQKIVSNRGFNYKTVKGPLYHYGGTVAGVSLVDKVSGTLSPLRDNDRATVESVFRRELDLQETGMVMQAIENESNALKDQDPMTLIMRDFDSKLAEIWENIRKEEKVGSDLRVSTCICYVMPIERCFRALPDAPNLLRCAHLVNISGLDY